MTTRIYETLHKKCLELQKQIYVLIPMSYDVQIHKAINNVVLDVYYVCNICGIWREICSQR